MRNVQINNKRYKLPASIKPPTTQPFPSKPTRNTPGFNFYRPSMFMPIPDISAKSKAELAIPQSKVEEKIVTDYTAKAKEADKSQLDGLDIDNDIIFETLKKLKAKNNGKSKGKKKGGKEAPKARKKNLSKKNKSSSLEPFAISS